MDKEIHLSEEKTRFENVQFTVHRGILTAMTAIAPIANRLMAQNKFSSLSDNMNRDLALLAATGNFRNYPRFENNFKSITTDAGKEVARSKKMTSNAGKEFTLFLPPEPIQGKLLGKSKMFGSQLAYLFKQEETSAKCGKHTSTPKKGEDMPSRRASRIFSSRVADIGAAGMGLFFNLEDEFNASHLGGMKGTVSSTPIPVGRPEERPPSRRSDTNCHKHHVYRG